MDPHGNNNNNSMYWNQGQFQMSDQHAQPIPELLLQPSATAHPNPQNYSSNMGARPPPPYPTNRHSIPSATGVHVTRHFTEPQTRPLYSAQRATDMHPGIGFPFQPQEPYRLDRCQVAHYCAFARHYQQQQQQLLSTPPQVQLPYHQHQQVPQGSGVPAQARQSFRGETSIAPAVEHYQVSPRLPGQRQKQSALSSALPHQAQAQQLYQTAPTVDLAGSTSYGHFAPRNPTQHNVPIASTSGEKVLQTTNQHAAAGSAYNDCSSISGSDDDKEGRSQNVSVNKAKPKKNAAAAASKRGNQSAMGTPIPVHPVHKKLNYKRWTSAADTQPSCSKAAGNSSSQSRPVAGSSMTELETMVNQLRLSPYITRDEAIGRLQAIGSCEAVQKEMDDFAALISMSQKFQAQTMFRSAQVIPGGGGPRPAHYREETSSTQDQASTQHEQLDDPAMDTEPTEEQN